MWRPNPRPAQMRCRLGLPRRAPWQTGVANLLGMGNKMPRIEQPPGAGSVNPPGDHKMVRSWPQRRVQEMRPAFSAVPRPYSPVTQHQSLLSSKEGVAPRW